MTFDDLSPELFYVAMDYSMPDLSEPEEIAETWTFIEHERLKTMGHVGDVKIDTQWHMLWAFGSRMEADRFIDEWGGEHFDALMQMRVTERRQ